jgi:hypothetical protein
VKMLMSLDHLTTLCYHFTPHAASQFVG